MLASICISLLVLFLPNLGLRKSIIAMTHLQACHISMSFLLQMASEKTLIKLNTFQLSNKK